MKTATLIREINPDCMFWRLSEPLDGYSLALTSQATCFLNGPETLIFPASERGKAISFEPLGESEVRCAEHSHKKALEIEGYEVRYEE